MSALFAPVGSILNGVIIDRLGRRTALLFSILPTVIGWLLLFSDYSLLLTFFGLIFNGISSGASGYPSQVYCGECIMVNRIGLRNNYLSWLGVSVSFGMFLVLVLGCFFNYQQICGIASSIAVISFLLIYSLIPESPTWLCTRGRIGDAEWSQKQLRISQPILQNRDVVEGPSVIEHENLCHWPSMKTYLCKVVRRDVYKPLLIMVMLFVLLTFCGGIAVMTYLVNVINEISIDADVGAMSNTTGRSVDLMATDSYKYGAISGILMLIANVSVFFFVSSVGTKKILSASSAFMAVGFLILAYTTTRDVSSSSLVTTHILAVWLIIFCFNFGVMNLPNAILGDVFPVDAKGFASVVYVLEFILTGFLLKIHPYMATAFGGYLYYGYATVSAASAVYIAVFMMETVGKSLTQINEEFLRNEV